MQQENSKQITLRIHSRVSDRLSDRERDLVRQALEATEGNQVRAARLLGISRDALRNRMKKFGFLSST